MCIAANRFCPDRPAPTAPPSAAFESVLGAGPNRRAHATVLVDPPRAEIECSIRYTPPAGSASDAQGLGNRRTDASGRMTWSWIIGARTGAGQGTVHVKCGNSDEIVAGIDIS